MDSTTEEKKEKIGATLLIANFTLACFVVSLSFMIYNTRHEVVPVPQEAKKQVVTTAFDRLSLDAKSVVVWDITKHQIIFAKHADDVRPLASITKVMTAVTALSILPKNTTITVRKEFLAEEGDSGLFVDEKWNFKNLLDFSLMVSSNDGARSIAAVAGAFASTTSNYSIGLKTFISKMNENASRLGLSSMKFANETGLDVSTVESGGYGSALDVAKLMEYAMKTYPDVFEVTKDKTKNISSLDKKHTAVNTDQIVSKIPNILASKTGYTNLSGGNLAIVFDAGVGRPVVVVALGSTYTGRFTDIEKLASSTLVYLKDNGE